MSEKSYAQLLKRIEELIARGSVVTNPSAKTPPAEIHDWISKTELYLSLLEDKIPKPFANFQQIRQDLEFKVDEDALNVDVGEDDVKVDEDDEYSSGSAYRPERSDVLLDFNFKRLAEANNILKWAAAKLELELEEQSAPANLAQSPPADLANEELGKKLLAARTHAGHSQEVAAEKLGCNQKTISQWEKGTQKPHPEALKRVRDYIIEHSKPKQP